MKNGLNYRAIDESRQNGGHHILPTLADYRQCRQSVFANGSTDAVSCTQLIGQFVDDTIKVDIRYTHITARYEHCYNYRSILATFLRLEFSHIPKIFNNVPSYIFSWHFYQYFCLKNKFILQNDNMIH